MTRAGGLLELLEDDELVLADKGYIGEIQIITPVKGKNLSDFDKQWNRTVGSMRWMVEHVLCRIKVFKAVNEKWRYWRDLHFIVFFVICEIVNIDIMYRPMRK